MWQANKWGIIALVIGMAIVGALYFWFQSQGDADMANKVGCTGICAVLFLVGLGSFLSARKGMNALKAEEEDQEDAENETEEQ